MAQDTNSKAETAAEKAYADAASNTASASKVAEAVKADGPKPEPKVEAIAEAVKAPAKEAAPKKAVARKAVVKKTAAKKAAAKKVPVRKAAPRKVAARTKAPVITTPKIDQLKETIMATNSAKTTKNLTADVQERAKAAYAKGSEYAAEMGDFTKANLEAVVESGKILASGMQDMGRGELEAAKGAFETVTADMKDFAAIKSPTELFQLQGKIARRNFDAVVAHVSQNAEKSMKLANDAFAPISSRMSVAAERFTKAA